MKTILYLIQKEFIQIRRNKTMLRVIIMVPLLQMLVLVFAATYDKKNIDVYMVDKDLSSTSRQLASKLEGSPFFTIVGFTQNDKEAEEAVKDGKCHMTIEIPSGFEKDLLRENKGSIQLLIDAIDGQTAQIIYSYTSAVIRDFNKSIIAEWKAIPEFNPPYQINSISRFWYNSELEYKWYMAPGILSILVTIIGLFLSGMGLVREKEIGTIEQLNVTPIGKFHFILGKFVPAMIIALLDLGFGLLLARLVFDLPIVGSLTLLFGFSALYLVSILGLGLLISTIADTQQQVMFVTYFFLMIFILMGGIFTPVESMPLWAQKINLINPVYHFMKVMRMIVLKGSHFVDLLQNFLSLLVLGFILVSLAIWRYKKVV